MLQLELAKCCRILQLAGHSHHRHARKIWYRFIAAREIVRRVHVFQRMAPITHAVHQAYRQMEQPRMKSTIDEELDKFRVLAKSWWDEAGEFKALHALNNLRVPLIRDAVLSARSSGDDRLISQIGPEPLKGSCVLDVGCGGGILTEPLARLGATVTGIDVVKENITMAQMHAAHDPGLHGRLKYVHQTAEDCMGTEAQTFDVVVASEVLEHVGDVEQLVSTCVDLVKPSGSIIFTTINKTWLSYMMAIVGAEDIFRVVPYGSHNWERFIPPEELTMLLEDRGCQVKLMCGMLYNPLTHRWSWVDMQSCNYAMHAIKADDQIARPDVEPEEHEIEHNSSHDR